MTNDYGNLELHKVLLSAMKDIDRICRENGLKCFLHAGTLLGAVNYKGFIPWDDDVDISMFREDYETFLVLAQRQLGDRYFIQTYKTDPSYPNNRAVLRVLGTKVVHYHEDANAVHNEIAIDIVPLDAVPNFKLVQKFSRDSFGFWMRRYRSNVVIFSPYRLRQNVLVSFPEWTVSRWEGGSIRLLVCVKTGSPSLSAY